MGTKWLEQNKDAHKDKRMFIIGCGPSIANTDLSLIKDLTFSVNGIFLKGFIPDYYATISADFWKFYLKEIIELRCKQKFIPEDMRCYVKDDGATTYINYRRPRSVLAPEHFSYEPHKYLEGGGTVLFVCFQIAYWLGVAEVILLGVDHNWAQEFPNTGSYKGSLYYPKGNDTVHFTKDYVPKGKYMHASVPQIEKAFRLGLEAFEKDGRTIVNATPGTQLKVIPTVRYEDAV